MNFHNNWQTKTLSEIFEELKTSERGLDKSEAAFRLKQYGANKLSEPKIDSLFVIFFRQFANPLIYILLASSLIVFLMGEIIDGSIILAVLLFNAIVGTIQEGKAQNTLLALKKLVETKAVVLREGEEFIISDTEIVLGDIIFLSEGEKVPADARIIFSNNLNVDEAAITGESEPVYKIADIKAKQSVSEISPANMIFKGTHIASGNGQAVVVATGVGTIIGKIAKQIASIDTEIPLRANIRNLSRIIIWAVLGISAALFAVGITYGKSIKEMFATVVSLSVSIIPEGLPIVVTLILATGVWRMSRQNVLVKKLQAVESLGQAKIIAVDKTGTITKNELVVQKIYVDGKIFDIGGVGYEPNGEVYFNGQIVDPINHPELLLAGKIAAFCADARLMFSEELKEWKISGDPTEAAMLVFAEKLGIKKYSIEQEAPIVAQMPFDYRLKYHAVVHGGENPMLTVVGAPEVILELSEKIWRSGKNHPFSKKEKEELESVYLSFSETGLRVVALAQISSAPKILKPEAIHNLNFIGFFGMKDALRPEISVAMRKAKEAGVKVVMITGDHKTTAQAIAKEAGIYQEGDLIITGDEVDKFSERELSEKIIYASVYARVNPDHKLKIINAYRKRGEIIAMTGDGVNDAASLVAADLGVAMGKIGTEVAKEASDIVLLNDNFGNIISAIEEGRSIYKTIKKVILYLFSTSLGEVLTISGALFLGLPLPVLPAQIIWLNFITDGFLDVSLAMEPKEKGLLKGNFEHSQKYLVDKLMLKRMFFMALPMAIGTLFIFNKYVGGDMLKAWTMSLTVLAVFQWFNAWNCRSEDKSIFKLNPFSNKFLIAATLLIIFFHSLAIYTPVMQKVLRTVALNFSDWVLIVSVAVSIIIVEEIRKFLKNFKK
ncbi:HAD-IC family P-type ATPase [Candidatus Wolfebacteria bacterium]|nr:HAD-IC family P-type ATPase [Candidatus Wolfebacteria bacterium]